MRVIAAICDPAQLELTVPEWRALLDQSPGVSIFQTPEWCLAWWRAFGRGGLHVIVSRSGRGLDAVAPLYVRPSGNDAPPSLVVIGTGNSDQLDAIASSRSAAVAVVDAAAGLADLYSWRLDWRRLPRSSPLYWACSVGVVTDEVPCPVLTHVSGFDPSLSAASPGSVLLAEVIAQAINDGVDTFDFLSGQEPYKYEWGAVDRPYFARTLERRTSAVPA